MAKTTDSSVAVPYADKVLGESGTLSLPWENFFRWLYTAVLPLGVERSYQLLNNKATPQEIEGIQFDYTKVNQVKLEFLIQRITQNAPGSPSVEKIETGVFYMVYSPYAEIWRIYRDPNSGPDNAGITFSTDAAGKLYYESTNLTGSPAVSKVSIRASTLSAKVNKTGGWL